MHIPQMLSTAFYTPDIEVWQNHTIREFDIESNTDHVALLDYTQPINPSLHLNMQSMTKTTNI